MVLFERDDAAGGAGFFADFGFAFGTAAPIDIGEPAAALTLQPGLQFGIGIELMGIRDHGSARLLIQVELNLAKQPGDVRGDLAERGFGFARRTGDVAAREDGFTGGDVAGADFDAQGYTAHLPVVELEAGREAFALIEADAQAGLLEFRDNAARGIHDLITLFGLAPDR